MLADKLREAEHDVLKEQHSKMVILSAQDLIHKFYLSGSLLHLYGQTTDEMILAKFQNSAADIKKELRTMKQMTEADEDATRRVKDVANAASVCIAAMDHYIAAVQQGKPTRSIGPEMEEALRQLIIEINDFVKAQESQSAKAPQDRARSRRAVVNLMYAGSFIFVLVGVALVVLFARGTVSRLDTLVQNTKRLSKNEPLLEPVKGGDEIAHLDGVFHDMANSLMSAAKHKQELMQMVSHDLRTPLSSVQLTLSSLAEGIFGELPEAALERIRMTEYNTTRLMHLIRDLLDIERLEAGKLDMSFQETSVREFIDQSISTVKAYAEHKNITLERDETSAMVFADPDRLVQVIVNLLSNAIKFSKKNSKITISVEEKIDCTEIQVIDQGRGIPPEKLASVFERFQQVHKEDATTHQGSGLGLAISRAIIEAHHGEIGVRSVLDEGCTFWFRIPAGHQAQQASEASEHEHSS